MSANKLLQIVKEQINPESPEEKKDLADRFNKAASRLSEMGMDAKITDAIKGTADMLEAESKEKD